MENKQIKQKIADETVALMSLKVDNEELVSAKFKTIRNRVEELHKATGEKEEKYTQAFALIEAAMNAEYELFTESTNRDEKGQALILLRHKAAEVCELLQIRFA